MFVIRTPPEKMCGIHVWWAEPGDVRSHSQWFKERGWDWAEECVRGFVDDTGIYFYRGPNYDNDSSTIQAARELISEIRRTVALSAGTPVFAGMYPGEIGTRWEPRMLVTVL